MLPGISQRNKYLRYFRKLGATCAEKAIKLEDYGLRKSLVFHHLLEASIIKETYDYRYYVDQAIAKTESRRRRSVVALVMVFIICFVIVTLIVFDYFTGDKLLMIEKW